MISDSDVTPSLGLCIGMLHLAEVDGHFDPEEEQYIRSLFPEDATIDCARAYKEAHSFKHFIELLANKLSSEQAECIMLHYVKLAHADNDFSFFERQFITKFAEQTGQSFDPESSFGDPPSVEDTLNLLG